MDVDEFHGYICNKKFGIEFAPESQFRAIDCTSLIVCQSDHMCFAFIQHSEDILIKFHYIHSNGIIFLTLQLTQSTDMGGVDDDGDDFGDLDVPLGLGGEDMNDIMNELMTGDGEGEGRAAARNQHMNSFFDGALGELEGYSRWGGIGSSVTRVVVPMYICSIYNRKVWEI